MPGVKTLETYEPKEIRGPGDATQFLTLPCTIESGQNLDIGQVIGKRPMSGKYGSYDKNAIAFATQPQANPLNQGNGGCSAVQVQNQYTLTEMWTLTCTGKLDDKYRFHAVGSVSGDTGMSYGHGLVTEGEEFSWPNTPQWRIKLTVTNGIVDFQEGDAFTFNTTAAGATVAEGILTEKVSAIDTDKISSFYVKGNFEEFKIIGLDNEAKESMKGKSVAGYLMI